VSGGVPVDRTYATILADDNVMLSSIYTVPRGSILEIDSIEVQTTAEADLIWSFHAGYGGVLKKVASGYINNTADAGYGAHGTSDMYEFKNGPHILEGPIDMKCKVDSVSATTGAVVTILGTLISTGETKLPEIKISDLAIEERLYSVTSKEDDDKNIDILRKLLIR
jgi:hypothetical protein